MGRLLNGINGPVIGKVGSVVGYSRNGQVFIKGPYKKRTKNVSDKELANRERFSLAQMWLKPLKDYVREGFKFYSQTAQGFIAAKSYLLRHAMQVQEGTFKVCAADMKVSFGALPLPLSSEVQQDSMGEIVFSWDKTCPKGASSYDQAMPLAYDALNGNAYFLTTGNFRQDGLCRLKIAADKGTFQLYLAFCAADRSTQSDSIYLGEITIGE